MKPMGPIPPGFGAVNGILAIDDVPVTHWIAEAVRTPLFLYSVSLLRQRMADLRAAMPDWLGIHYAMKANPFAPVVTLMNGLVDGIDIASAGELAMAQAAGVDPVRISFAGPGKRDDELRAAIAAGVTINLESAGEADRALAIAVDLSVIPRLAVRVNPPFDLKGSGMKMGGGAKQFGVDHDQVPGLVRHLVASGADYRGFHIFAGSQSLSAEALIEAQGAAMALAAALSEQAGIAPPKVNLGGGFGIAYFPGDVALDIKAVGAALEGHYQGRAAILKDTAFCIELGRYLVGEAGVYITRIVDRKVSRGETFVVTDGGLHHQLAASGNFGTVIRRNYPQGLVERFAVGDSDSSGLEQVTVVGCLCTPLDLLGDKVGLPAPSIGDHIAIFCAGAYGASASPGRFLGQGEAVEMLV